MITDEDLTMRVAHLHFDLNEAVKKDPSKSLGSVTRGLIIALAEDVKKAHPDNSVADQVIKLATGTRLDVSDGLALVGQLQASL